jgi:hypothetical protein
MTGLQNEYQNTRNTHKHWALLKYVNEYSITN